MILNSIAPGQHKESGSSGVKSLLWGGGGGGECLLQAADDDNQRQGNRKVGTKMAYFKHM